MLHDECRRRGLWISYDGRLKEKDAADLMCLAPKTLRNRRSMMDDNLPGYEIRKGRALYSIVSIAAWMKPT